MIDHLLIFATEAAAHLALDPLGYGGTDSKNNPYWNTSICIPNTQIITTRAVYNNAVPPVLVTPQVIKTGWWITISLPTRNAALQALGGCAAIFNRDDGTRLFVTANVTQAIALASAAISPVFFGSNYNFGV